MMSIFVKKMTSLNKAWVLAKKNLSSIGATEMRYIRKVAGKNKRAELVLYH